jgi:hypothetical protein
LGKSSSLLVVGQRRSHTNLLVDRGPYVDII